MTEQKNQLIGNENSLIYLPDTISGHLRSALCTCNCLFMCQLANMTEEEFTNKKGVGPSSVKNAKQILDIAGLKFRSANENRLPLGKKDAANAGKAVNYVPSFPWSLTSSSDLGYIQETKDRVLELKKYLAEQLDLSADINPKIDVKKLSQPKSMKRFCADDFEIVSSYRDEGLKTISVDITMPTSVANLIKFNYLEISGEFTEAVQDVTKARTVEEVSNNDIAMLCITYDDDLHSIRHLFRENVMAKLAEAMNPFYEKAQLKARADLAKQAKSFGLD